VGEWRVERDQRLQHVSREARFGRKLFGIAERQKADIGYSMTTSQLHRHRFLQRVFEKDLELADLCRALFDLVGQAHLVEGELVCFRFHQ
jgi:hypothetical protein